MELERLRYFYAVVEVIQLKPPLAIYHHCDGGIPETQLTL